MSVLITAADVDLLVKSRLLMYKDIYPYMSPEAVAKHKAQLKAEEEEEAEEKRQDIKERKKKKLTFVEGDDIIKMMQTVADELRERGSPLADEVESFIKANTTT